MSINLISNGESGPTYLLARPLADGFYVSAVITELTPFQQKVYFSTEKISLTKLGFQQVSGLIAEHGSCHPVFGLDNSIRHFTFTANDPNKPVAIGMFGKFNYINFAFQKGNDCDREYNFLGVKGECTFKDPWDYRSIYRETSTPVTWYGLSPPYSLGISYVDLSRRALNIWNYARGSDQLIDPFPDFKLLDAVTQVYTKNGPIDVSSLSDLIWAMVSNPSSFVLGEGYDVSIPSSYQWAHPNHIWGQEADYRDPVISFVNGIFTYATCSFPAFYVNEYWVVVGLARSGRNDGSYDIYLALGKEKKMHFMLFLGALFYSFGDFKPTKDFIIAKEQVTLNTVITSPKIVEPTNLKVTRDRFTGFQTVNLGDITLKLFIDAIDNEGYTLDYTSYFQRLSVAESSLNEIKSSLKSVASKHRRLESEYNNLISLMGEKEKEIMKLTTNQKFYGSLAIAVFSSYLAFHYLTEKRTVDYLNSHYPLVDAR